MSYSPGVTSCAGPMGPLTPPLQAPLGKGCSQSEGVGRGEIGTCPREGSGREKGNARAACGELAREEPRACDPDQRALGELSSG